jgi:hypothetical protein
MKPPSSLALAAGRQSRPAFGPSKSAQADLEPRPSAPQGGEPDVELARRSRFRGGKLDRTDLFAMLVAPAAAEPLR